jgi:hypothetical protein
VFGCTDAGPILIGMAMVTELNFGLLRHGLNLALAKGRRLT